MKFYPQNLIIPAVIITCLCLVLLSTVINSGFAQPALSQSADPSSDPNNYSAQLSQRFPQSIQQWKTLIEFSAADFGLDPNLIAAVMLQESGGDSLAYSSSGAVGLMQVMPNDGLASEFICGNQPCFLNRPSINELQDPEFNVQFGSHLLAALINHEGSEREALKSYGPMDMGYDYADIILVIYEKYR
jgi:soluble lytic murein transglycosylase-like protein